MSNDLVLSQIQKQLAELNLGVDDESRAVAGSSFRKRISIKGGVFRKFIGGKEIAQIQDRWMNIIFVKMAPTPARMFYPDAFVEGQKVAPSCWSSDSQVPDPEVKVPVAKSCSECPNSIKGSGRDGKGTACRLSWRTAVVLPNDPSGDIMQLVLPAASAFGKEHNGTFPFRPYVQYLVNHNVSAGAVVTKMEFDLRQPSPTLLFSPVAALSKEQMEVVKAQGKTQFAEAAIRMTVFQPDEEESVDGEDEVVPPPAVAEAAQVAGAMESHEKPSSVTSKSEQVSNTTSRSDETHDAVRSEPVLRAKPDSSSELRAVNTPIPTDRPVADIIAKWAAKKS